LLGKVFYDHVINDDHVEALRTGLAALQRLLEQYENGGGTFRIAGLELVLPLPGVTGAFGSVDLIMVNKTTVVVVDWKFGGGVKVVAVYSDEAGDTLNPQLAFYTAAARDRFRRRFKGKTIVCAIIQPRFEEPLTFSETDDDELDAFLASFQAAFLEALGRDPHRERGDHCRFASCKATCKLWVGALFDLALIDPVKAALKAAANPAGYGRFLSEAMDLATYAESWSDEIRRQVHAYLEGGGVVENWKLVPKRATRQWVDSEENTSAALRGIGATDTDLYTEQELRSVAQMEKALKKKAIELPETLWHSISSGLTVAPIDDARPTASHSVIIPRLREALIKL
jgi:hypothetical protein